jgi:tail sheath protein
LPRELIIPGVSIEVVKEIVPQSLTPSGVVGMLGTSPRGPILEPTPVTTYREFAEKFGADPNYSLTRDVKLSFLNGVFEVFVTRIEGAGGKTAALLLKGAKKRDTIRMESKVPGAAGNSIRVEVDKGTIDNSVMMRITYGERSEFYDALKMDSTSDAYLVNTLNLKSSLVKAEDLKPPAIEFPDNNPLPIDVKLEGGTSAPPKFEDWERALEGLEGEPDVDAVYAADVDDPKIHAIINAHCQNMSTDAKNRIGVGTVGKGESIKDMVARAQGIKSDRFVLTAPNGIAGAVVGLISKLRYYDSPTFKPLQGLAPADIWTPAQRRFYPSEIMELLKAGILPVDLHRERGIIVVKGITTTKEQISVTRISDRAVRGVKNVSDNFIGTLNSPGGRIALREKIREFLSSMEKEGALVPSTDLKNPAFMTDVYSSQLDFAQGIVRVDIAVRPVRAMDYIYSTITVQA